MTIKIDMGPRLQSAGAVNGFVRDIDLANKTKLENNSKVSKSNALNENVDSEKPSSEKVNDKLNIEKLNQDKSTELDKEKLDSVVTSLNSSIQSVQRDLEFSVDENSGQVVINVKDKETDKVVRQIPSEEALKLAENLQELVDSRRQKDSGSVEGIFVRTSA